MKLLSILILLFSLSVKAKTAIDTDRWLEIDLYWFGHDNIEKSVDLFWERYHPLMDDITGWKGIILNVGWLSDYILEWNGDLDKEIKLPGNMKINPGFKEQGQLAGSSLERIKLWKDRFEKSDGHKAIKYEPWTYGDFKKLVYLLKGIAREKYKLTDIKVGTSALGFQTIYGGDKSTFSKIHNNIYLNNSYINNAPNLEAQLDADPGKYGAFPQGIPDGTPFTEFFGKQWGHLSKALNLNIILLRDSYMGVGIYSRTGPYGKTAPEDAEKVLSWSKATSDLVKQVKISNPNALVFGYSNAASAVADWRVNCFDLETIAKEGYLDGWIDQTWAGAWNEVGVRPYPEFWNKQLKGWTYQLSYLLVHAAIFAETKVRHYFLTETFDAWECQDIIHSAPSRLRWGIWAYSHAAVKMPNGLKMPAGNCISWCNKGKDLLSEEDVSFLAETCNAAFDDAKRTKNVFGPTMVYCRSAMEWQSMNKPNQSIKEWIDEQVGTLIKWSVPVLSVTRSEYLPFVENNMFVFQSPVHLKSKEKADILNILKSGAPVAIFGSPAGGFDKDIMDIIGVATEDTSINGIKYIGTINYQTSGIFQSVPNTFPLFQPFTRNSLKPGVDLIYSVSNSPCLALNQIEERQILFWDPPELSDNLPSGSSSSEYGESLDQILGSPVPYVLTARAMNEMSKKSRLAYVSKIEQNQPLSLAIWQLEDGSYEILAGNTEEGINHTTDHTVQTVLNLPQLLRENIPAEVLEKWHGERYIISTPKLEISLEQAQSKLYKIIQ